MNRLVEIFATYFYVGKIPKAPGTWGTLAALPLWYGLSFLNPLWYMTVVFILVLSSIFICQIYEKNTESHDSKEIVIDEVVGFLITMTWLPVTWQSAVFGFVVFRFLDILKPPPIRQLDQKVQGGVGVVIDDVAAGILANILLQIVYNQTGWLGAQIQTL